MGPLRATWAAAALAILSCSPPPPAAPPPPAPVDSGAAASATPSAPSAPSSGPVAPPGSSSPRGAWNPGAPPGAPGPAVPGPLQPFSFGEKPLAGCIFEPARVFAARYCADCHTTRGTNRLHERASEKLLMDSYADWLAATKAIPRRVDRDSLQGKIMPPLTYPEQPTDAERRMIADWAKRGSPNTPDGR